MQVVSVLSHIPTSREDSLDFPHNLTMAEEEFSS
jgi:hypothetical protein